MEKSDEQKKQAKLIDRLVIPLNFISKTQILKNQQNYGIINFASEPYHGNLGNLNIQNEPYKETLTYKTTTTNYQGNQKQTSSKKTNQYHKITLKSKELKRKYFTILIPTRTNRGVKVTTKQHFILQFNNKEGNLTMASQYLEANMELQPKNPKAKRTLQQMADLQRKKLDNRRKDPNTGLWENDQDQDQEDEPNSDN